MPGFSEMERVPYPYVETRGGPDDIIPGPWPELTPLALWFRQEPPFIIVNNGVRPS